LIFNSYFNAKLLLTAEYLVLNGATALAMPLRFGQSLSVQASEQNLIAWQSFSNDGSVWFSAEYSLEDFRIISCSNPEIAVFPQRLLTAARTLNHEFCAGSSGFSVVATLNYPLTWGLGSSSTLTAAVAGWAGIDPFLLYFEVSAGSGYDIACATATGPVLYSVTEHKPLVKQVHFSPAFAGEIYFVYQGQKQDSAHEVARFRARIQNPDKTLIESISLLSDSMLHSSSLDEFEEVIKEHEKLMSNLLEVPPLKESRFSDLPGEVKSLGAWGGDFCMITWHKEPHLLSAYLKSKGLEIVFNFNDIVL